jgi:hypothetical protein
MLPCWISQRSCDLGERPAFADGDVGEHGVAQQTAAAERAIGREDVRADGTPP